MERVHAETLSISISLTISSSLEIFSSCKYTTINDFKVYIRLYCLLGCDWKIGREKKIKRWLKQVRMRTWLTSNVCPSVCLAFSWLICFSFCNAMSNVLSLYLLIYFYKTLVEKLLRKIKLDHRIWCWLTFSRLRIFFWDSDSCCFGAGGWFGVAATPVRFGHWFKFMTNFNTPWIFKLHLFMSKN